MRAVVLEKLRAAAAARMGSAPAPEPRPRPAPVPEPAPAATPAPAGEPTLEAAICFHVPGAGDVWLVPSARDAERLGLRRGEWVVPGDLALLELLEPPERLEVLRWMRTTGGALAAAPKPASRRPAVPKPRLERNLPTSAFVLPEELRLQAQALGWKDEHLATLASLLHPGDRIGAVSASSIEIVRKSGAVQRFYSPDAPQAWRRKLEGASD
jgi:hypothetical protein